MNDDDIMPFGCHHDKRMRDVPAKYLRWLHGEGCTHPGVAKYIRDNMDRLQIKEYNVPIIKPTTTHKRFPVSSEEAREMEENNPFNE